MAKKISILMFILFLGISSCAHQRTQVSQHPGSMIPSYIQTEHFFLLGIGQTRLLNGYHICKNKKVTTVETSYTPIDFLLTLLTVGIYMPKTIKIYCDDGSNS